MKNYINLFAFIVFGLFIFNTVQAQTSISAYANDSVEAWTDAEVTSLPSDGRITDLTNPPSEPRDCSSSKDCGGKTISCSATGDFAKCKSTNLGLSCITAGASCFINCEGVVTGQNCNK